jgi:O-antigen/teichoic acid export membrane protein
MYPALASIQDDTERLKRGYRKSVVLSTFIHFPLMIGLIVTTQPLITLLFSAGWEGSVLFFQLLCLAGLPYPLSAINVNILKVKGRSDLFLRIEIIKRALMITNALVTYRWGISAILLGHVAVASLAYFLNSFYSERLIAYPMRTQILDVWPSLLCAGLMGGGVWLIGGALGAASDFLRLVVQTGVGAIVYLALNWALKTEALQEVMKIVVGWTARRRGTAPGNA